MVARPGRTRARLGQNLFRSREAARRLVSAARFAPGERVYDLGAGTGAVAAELLRAGACVVAVEQDANLARKLGERFAGERIEVVQADLRQVGFAAPFKVVANPPFNLSTALVRRLLVEGPHPQGAWLVLQREAAERFAGARAAGPLYLAAAPWFEVSVTRPFARSDFVPAPQCEVALLRARRRPTPLLSVEERAGWLSFVRHAFDRPGSDARRTFRDVFSNLQWRRLSSDLGIASNTARTQLSLAQWITLYRFARDFTPAGLKLMRARPGERR